MNEIEHLLILLVIYIYFLRMLVLILFLIFYFIIIPCILRILAFCLTYAESISTYFDEYVDSNFLPQYFHSHIFQCFSLWPPGLKSYKCLSHFKN